MVWGGVGWGVVWCVVWCVGVGWSGVEDFHSYAECIFIWLGVWLGVWWVGEWGNTFLC